MNSTVSVPRMGDVVRAPQAQTLIVRPTAGSACVISRTAVNESNHGRNAPYTLQDGYLVGVHMRPFADYDMWLRGRRQRALPLTPGALWFHHMELEAQVDFRGPFDIVCSYVPHTALAELPGAEGCKGTAGHLHCPELGARDPIIEHLTRCLSTTLGTGGSAHTLFADSVLMALLVHLATAYGSGAVSPRPVRAPLAPWQVRQAKEFIDANLADGCTLRDLATSCGLSPAHFLRAFKATVGVPPHQWLTLRRIERAKGLLRSSDKSMSEIAASLGFCNQSHFARAFAQSSGCAPGAWRRAHRCLDSGTR